MSPQCHLYTFEYKKRKCLQGTNAEKKKAKNKKQTFTGKLATSILGCLSESVHTVMGNNHEELEVCVQLKGSDIGIAEMWWDGVCHCSAEIGYKLFRKYRQGGQGGRVTP